MGGGLLWFTKNVYEIFPRIFQFDGDCMSY